MNANTVSRPANRPVAPPLSRSAAAAPPAKSALPALTFLAHIDATPKELEPYEVAEVDAFEKAYRPDTRVRVQLCRESTPVLQNLGLGLMEVAAVPIAAALAPTLGPLGFPVLLGGMFLAADGGKRFAQAYASWSHNREPAWNGTRVYDIGPDKRVGRIDSPIVEQRLEDKPDRTQLTRFLAEGMKKYPAQVTAVMLSGHGLAYKNCTGLGVAAVKEALDQASAQSGRKIDVLILEACLMGNLESLQTLSNSARYVVVSEETMGAAGMPWANIMQSLPKDHLTAEQFGRNIMDWSTDDGNLDTLAVIDLQKIAPLSNSVESLAHELRRVVAQGGKSEVRAALRHAPAYPRWTDPLDRMSFNMRDLGGVVDGVKARIPDARVQQAADRVKAALQDAVVSSTHRPKYASAGDISIQSTQPFFKTEKYVNQTGFREWGALLHDLRVLA